MARVIMIFSKVPKKLWEYAIRRATFVLRVLPTSLNEDFTSPFMMINGEKAALNATIWMFIIHLYTKRSVNRLDAKAKKYFVRFP